MSDVVYGVKHDNVFPTGLDAKDGISANRERKGGKNKETEDN